MPSVNDLPNQLKFKPDWSAFVAWATSVPIPWETVQALLQIYLHVHDQTITNDQYLALKRKHRELYGEC